MLLQVTISRQRDKSMSGPASHCSCVLWWKLFWDTLSFEAAGLLQPQELLQFWKKKDMAAETLTIVSSCYLHSVVAKEGGQGETVISSGQLDNVDRGVCSQPWGGKVGAARSGCHKQELQVFKYRIWIFLLHKRQNCNLLYESHKITHPLWLTLFSDSNFVCSMICHVKLPPSYYPGRTSPFISHSPNCHMVMPCALFYWPFMFSFPTARAPYWGTCYNRWFLVIVTVTPLDATQQVKTVKHARCML